MKASTSSKAMVAVVSGRSSSFSFSLAPCEVFLDRFWRRWRISPALVLLTWGRFQIPDSRPLRGIVESMTVGPGVAIGARRRQWRDRESCRLRSCRPALVDGVDGADGADGCWTERGARGSSEGGRGGGEGSVGSRNGSPASQGASRRPGGPGGPGAPRGPAFQPPCAPAYHAGFVDSWILGFLAFISPISLQPSACPAARFSLLASAGAM